MKNQIIVAILICISSLLYSQDNPARSVIYANDGSVYVGEIVSENILDIKMIIGTLDTITLDKRTIKKLNSPPQDIIMYEKGKYHRTGGLFYSFSLSSSTVDQGAGILNFIVGKRLNEKWHAGVGVAFSGGTTILPGFEYID